MNQVETEQTSLNQSVHAGYTRVTIHVAFVFVDSIPPLVATVGSLLGATQERLDEGSRISQLQTDNRVEEVDAEGLLARTHPFGIFVSTVRNIETLNLFVDSVIDYGLRVEKVIDADRRLSRVRFDWLPIRGTDTSFAVHCISKIIDVDAL